MEVFVIKYIEIDYSDDKVDIENIETFYDEIKFKNKLAEVKKLEDRLFIKDIKVYSGYVPRIE